MTDPTRLSRDEVRDLRAAFEYEAAAARVDYPSHLLMDVFDRACFRAATRPGRQGGPENPRPKPDPTAAGRPPEDIEAEAGKLLVEAARLRAERAGPTDAHELRHLLAAVNAGNSDPCDGGAACHLDAAGLAQGRAGRPDLTPFTEAGRSVVFGPDDTALAYISRAAVLAIEAEAFDAGLTQGRSEALRHRPLISLDHGPVARLVCSCGHVTEPEPGMDWEGHIAAIRGNPDD